VTVADEILRCLENVKAPMTDSELAKAIGKSHQTINQAARRLAEQRVIVRGPGPGGGILNALNKRSARQAMEWAKQEVAGRRQSGGGGLISEDQVKQAVKDHLETDGWKVRVAWGRAQGIDIEATKGRERLVVEAKGEAELQPQQVNYFLGALGELIQRMDDPRAIYGLALPDNKQYRGLVARLPQLAVERLGLIVYWVKPGGIISVEGNG
jgi:hypothetical protein